MFQNIQNAVVKLKIFIESSVISYQFCQSLGAGCKKGQYKHQFTGLII